MNNDRFVMARARSDWERAGRAELVAALNWAAEQHADQYRDNDLDPDDAEPYIEHPVRVARTLEQAGIGDDDTLQAALFHDVQEDCGVPKEEIARRIGPVAGDVVDLVSKRPGEPKATTLRRAFSDWRSAVLKWADRLDNIRSLHTRKLANRLNYSRQTLEQFMPHLAQCVTDYPEHAAFFERSAAEIEQLCKAYLAETKPACAER